MKNCEKFKSLFVFGHLNALQDHIKECAICRKKYEKMRAVEDLVRVAKPLYHANKNTVRFNFRLSKYKVIACIALIALVIPVSMSLYYNDQNGKPIYVVQNSIFRQMNLPTDEYGILRIDKDVTYND